MLSNINEAMRLWSLLIILLEETKVYLKLYEKQAK